MEKLVTLIDHMGNDLTVVNAARVSFDKHKDALDEGDVKLIKYLARNQHTSPFMHPQIQLRIKMPIFIVRQYLRSTVGMSINEVSRRYVSKEPEFFIPKEFRNKPSGSVKQGSEGVHNLSPLITQELENFCNQAKALYEFWINQGVCPEQARMVLPQNMYTEFYQTGSLYFFARVVKQRLDPHAQKEIQEYARLVSEIIEPLYPHSWAALLNNE